MLVTVKATQWFCRGHVRVSSERVREKVILPAGSPVTCVDTFFFFLHKVYTGVMYVNVEIVLKHGGHI